MTNNYIALPIFILVSILFFGYMFLNNLNSKIKTNKVSIKNGIQMNMLTRDSQAIKAKSIVII